MWCEWSRLQSLLGIYWAINSRRRCTSPYTRLKYSFWGLGPAVCLISKNVAFFLFSSLAFFSAFLCPVSKSGTVMFCGFEQPLLFGVFSRENAKLFSFNQADFFVAVAPSCGIHDLRVIPTSWSFFDANAYKNVRVVFAMREFPFPLFPVSRSFLAEGIPVREIS